MLHKSKQIRVFVLALLLTVWFPLAATSAQAYGSWVAETEFDPAPELDRLIAIFSQTVQNAKASKAAHPDFIADLKNLVLEFEKCQGKLSSHPSGSSTYGTSQNVEMQVRYLGRTADKIGPWERTGPDGDADEHAQILIYFPAATQVQSIRIWTSNEKGKQGNTWWWSDSTGRDSPR